MTGTETTITTLEAHENRPATPLRLVGDVGGHVSQEATESVELDLQPYSPQPPEFDPTVNSHPPPADAGPQPDWWPSNWRSIPGFRPVNRHLDQSVRAQGFPYNVGAVVMLLGCMTIANTGQLWRYTAQKIVPGWGEYPVGGEF